MSEIRRWAMYLDPSGHYNLAAARQLRYHHRTMHRLVRGAVFFLAIVTAVSRVAHPQSSDPAAAPLRGVDRLLVKVWFDTAFADTIRIDETGTAILPRLGPLSVSGLVPETI